MKTDRPVAVSFRPEHAEEHGLVSALQARIFGLEKLAHLVDGLRAVSAPLPPVSIVATVDRNIVGHVMLSAGRLDAPRRLVDVYVLSPLGVLPQYQRMGIGTELIARALAGAEAAGVALVFLEGSPDYYARRGFERASALGFRSPSLRIPDPAFQVARLGAYEPWMTGTLVYPEPFWALDCVGLRESQPE